MSADDALASPADWPDLGPGQMTPRERVNVALSHREPDRVPADFTAVPELWQRLRLYFGGLSRADILQRLRVDVRWVEPQYVGPRRTLPGGITVGPFGRWWKKAHHEFGSYDEYAGYPLADARTASEVQAWEWPSPDYWDVDEVRRQVAEIDARGEYFVVYRSGGIFERAWGFCGLEQFLLNLMLNPEVPRAIMDCLTDHYVTDVRRVLDACEGRIDMVHTWDDLAHQQGLLMSPAMWREHILPHHQRLQAAIRAYDVKISYHCCGALYPLLPDITAEMDIDVLDPLQPRAEGMDLKRIKEEFGSHLSFHGGVDIQHTLPHGTPADVRAEVRERCAVLGRDGGYILCSAHNMQNDTPVANIMTMYTTSRAVH